MDPKIVAVKMLKKYSFQQLMLEVNSRKLGPSSGWFLHSVLITHLEI